MVGQAGTGGLVWQRSRLPAGTVSALLIATVHRRSRTFMAATMGCLLPRHPIQVAVEAVCRHICSHDRSRMFDWM